MRAKQKKQKVLMIRITEGQHKKLKTIAKTRQRSASAVIRTMINRARGQLKVE